MSDRRGRTDATKKRLSQTVSEGLQGEEKLLKIARSDASNSNTIRAEKHFPQFASDLSASDPTDVSPESSRLVINFLYAYCKMGTNDPLTVDAFNAIAQGLRNIYSTEGHRGVWTINHKSNTTVGNPLRDNDDVNKLRSSLKVHRPRLGKLKRSALPLPIALVCEHALRYWFGCGQQIDYRDILLHAAMILGLNVGLRYDELRKISIQHVSVIPGISGDGRILLFIPESIKNCTKGCEYKVCAWPGNSDLRNCLITDPFVALLSWMRVRGTVPGICSATSTRKI